MGLRKPQLDVVTRWSSTFTMLRTVLDYKDFCQQNFTLLTTEEWVTIESIVSVLSPIHTLTLKLQACQLLLGDFYKYWLEMTLHLKNQNHELSSKLLNCIELRQTELVDNETMNAALFLDPRFRRLLSREKMQSAKNHLKHIIHRVESLKMVIIVYICYLFYNSVSQYSRTEMKFKRFLGLQPMKKKIYLCQITLPHF